MQGLDTHICYIRTADALSNAISLQQERVCLSFWVEVTQHSLEH